MRQFDLPIWYLAGTPKGRLIKLDEALRERPCQAVRDGVDVKLLPDQQELYVLARSRARIDKERGIRWRKLKWLWDPQGALRLAPEARRATGETGRRTGQGKGAWRLV
jgi:hypothetical protein